MEYKNPLDKLKQLQEEREKIVNEVEKGGNGRHGTASYLPPVDKVHDLIPYLGAYHSVGSFVRWFAFRTSSKSKTHLALISFFFSCVCANLRIFKHVTTYCVSISASLSAAGESKNCTSSSRDLQPYVMHAFNNCLIRALLGR